MKHEILQLISESKYPVSPNTFFLITARKVPFEIILFYGIKGIQKDGDSSIDPHKTRLIGFLSIYWSHNSTHHPRAAARENKTFETKMMFYGFGENR